MPQPQDQSLFTQGPLARGLRRLALPMFASALLQNAQSVIDLFWVGRLGRDSVAALALSGTILMMVFPAVMGLATGTVALVSRAVGARDFEAASHSAGQSLAVAVVAGLVAVAAGWSCAGWLCRLLGGEGDVLRLSTEYLRLTFLGMLPVFVLFIGNSALQAAGNTVVPMYAMVLSNLLNLGLDPILIFGWFGLPRLEIRGAAIATVAAEIVAAAMVVAFLGRGMSGLRIRRRHLRPAPSVAWRLIRLGIPSAGQMLSRSLMNGVLMRIVAQYGTVAVAAYGIGVRFHMVILMPAFALGNAAATLVGQNLGAGRPDRAAKAARLAAGVGMGLMASSAALLVAFAAPLMRLFTADPAVVATGATYLRIISLFHVFAAWSIVLGRALQGAGDTVTPMVTTILGLWGLQIPLAFILPRFVTPPIHGVWWSVVVALTANGCMVAACFQSGGWKRLKP